MGNAYTSEDAERFVPETHTSTRSAFTRDRARVIHSSAWRRLAAKTQVLSPTAGVDFARNRLTHSLEVAQIGRELAASFQQDPDIVDSACLAHDLGHPPFGHNGERALNEWALSIGGFEGNAQSLRVITRLEAKRFSSEGRSVGLNLTRATLDATCKYPWQLGDSSTTKFGFYPEDQEIFDWVRQSAPGRQQCAEAQVMDLADDIAYSVHDYEDAIVSEHIDPELLNDRAGHAALLRIVADWSGDRFSVEQLDEAYERIAATPTWLRTWDGSRSHQAQLKNFTSDMIGRFARSAITATQQNSPGATFTRYHSRIIVPHEVRAEIAVLKGIVAAYVMASGRRQPTYQRQRNLLTELLDTLWQTGEEHLEPAFAQDLREAASESEARRVIVDQVASLTDQAAIAWHSRLCSVPLV